MDLPRVDEAGPSREASSQKAADQRVAWKACGEGEGDTGWGCLGEGLVS